MSKWIIGLALSLCAGLAFAAAQPRYAPPPAWVKPATIPERAAKASDAAVQILLYDRQTRFGTHADEFYVESAFRILTPAGLSAVNQIAPSWDPQTQTLTFHRLVALRGGKTIDLLGGGKKVTVLRREPNLELAMLDGDLTATVQPQGLKVGDVIDFAFTLTLRDPVLRGRSEDLEALPRPGVASYARLRALWPSSKPMRWRATDGLPAPKVTRTGDTTELVVEATNFTAPKPPTGAPARFNDLAELEFTQFGDWAKVSALMAPLYVKAETVGADSPLKLEARKIAAATSDPKARAAAALRLVQDQVRYASIGTNLGGLVPADADVTWRRRFGDCKGKSALLAALLHELGIAAEPALVSTNAGDGLDDRLPMLIFDHVIVRARIGGKVYWLDGARTGDRDLDGIETPAFHWALPVQNSGARLEKLEAKPLSAPAFESVLRLDASAGLDVPAAVHAENIYRGDVAVAWNLGLGAAGKSAAENALRRYWRGRLPWVDIKSAAFAFDDARRRMTLTMDGSGKMDWTGESGARDFQIVDSNLGFEPSFGRDPGPGSDAPFAVAFPTYDEWKVVIALPDKGAGFGLLDAVDVDQTIAAHRYRRTSRIDDGVVTMTASDQTLGPEFPASDADAAAAALRQLNDFDVIVQDGSASAPAAQASAPDAGPTPTDAAGFDARAAGFLARRDYAHAVADLDQAVRLDPAAGKYVYNRGVAHFEDHQDDLAMADFDRALRLDPKDELALEARGQIYLFRGQAALANTDFDQAVHLAPGDFKVVERVATALQNAGQFGAAIAIEDRMIAKSATAPLYNARCWTRAASGADLQAALSDCDAALRLAPCAAAILDSRAFVELRLGRLHEAITGYSAALRAAPGHAVSLYGRGVAEIRNGDRQAGESDLAAARALSKRVAAMYARFGVTL